MLNTARSFLTRFKATRIEDPPNGTGPLGAPNGRRWITRDDVCVWNSRATVPTPEERRAYSSTLHTRHYTDAPNPLRTYQKEAVDACNPSEGVFRCGIVNMECGTGKTFVASELIRRSQGPCMVVAQHTSSVLQFVTHLNTTLGIRAVSLQDEDAGDFREYDVIVTTYSRVVPLVSELEEHRARIVQGDASPSYTEADRFLMEKLHEPFSLLLLDEAHTVVADKFLLACRFCAHAVVGLSGSLVREDDRLASLDVLVGPTLYSYGNTERVHHVHVQRLPMLDTRVVEAKTRTAIDQTVRALNPHKVDALMRILEMHADRRVIVFSDTVHPTSVLHETILQGRSLVLNGSVASRGVRDVVIDTFSRSAPGSMVLLCTKVCDVSIDFPVGCVIVQYHLISGSRQQEVQRCGRGARGSDGATVYHLLNEDTDEERFSERRIEHLKEVMWGKVHVDVETICRDPTPSCQVPLDSLAQIKMNNKGSETSRAPKRAKRNNGGWSRR